MFFLIKDRFTKKNANVKIFVDEKGLRDWTGVVEHGNRNGDFVFRDLFLLGWGLVFYFILYFLKPGFNDIKLLEKKVVHMLSVRFDNYADVSIVLFKLTQIESPVDVH